MRILTQFLIGLMGSWNVLQAATAITCPQGTRQLVRQEKTATVYTCGKPVSVCPESEKLEFVSEVTAGVEHCFIAHGPVYYQNADQSSLLMNYFNGILHGSVEATNAEAKRTLEEHYVQGFKEGRRRLFYPNGIKHLEENYVHGVRTGEVISWYPSGKKQKRYLIKEGKRDGIYTEWYENGNVRTEATFTAGMWNGPYHEWYSNGANYSTAEFKNGTIDGKYLLFYRSGNKMSQRDYVMGRMNGTFQEWEDSGMKEAESAYQDGRLLSYVYLSAKALMMQNSRRTIARNSMLQSCASMAGLGFSPEIIGKSQGCLKADFDGNGYMDNIISLPEDGKKSKVVLLKRDVVFKEFIIDEPLLEIYSARPTEGQFDEPATPRDGLVAWGKGGDTHVYLYDFDTEQFVKSAHASDGY